MVEKVLYTGIITVRRLSIDCNDWLASRCLATGGAQDETVALPLRSFTCCKVNEKRVNAHALTGPKPHAGAVSPCRASGTGWAATPRDTEAMRPASHARHRHYTYLYYIRAIAAATLWRNIDATLSSQFLNCRVTLCLHTLSNFATRKDINCEYDEDGK